MVDREQLRAFIATLDLPEDVRRRLAGPDAGRYLGLATQLAREI